MKYKGWTEYWQLIESKPGVPKDPKDIEKDIMNFMVWLKQQGYSLNSQKIYLNALTHFYDINDVTIRQRKMAKFMSNSDIRSPQQEGQGRGEKPYTHGQIAKLLEYADIRTKPMVLLMCSTAMRIGSLPMLKVGDLTQ